MKKAVLFTCIAFTLAVCLQVPARAESTSYSVGLKLNIEAAEGTVTGSYGTYSVDENDIVNSNHNYNIVLQNNSQIYNVTYFSFSLAGIYITSGDVGRYDVTMYLDFVGDFVTSDPVIGGEFIVGLWIQNYRESYDYSIDQVSFTGEGSGGTGFDTEYLGFSSIGCKLFKCTIRPDPNGNNSPLSKFRKIAVKWHWTGNPNSGEINFVFGNDSNLVCMTSDDADIDYMVEQNELARAELDQTLHDLTVDPPSVSDVSSNLSDDLSLNLENFDVIRVRSGSQFVAWLIGAGATSLGFAFIGYILYGKKA